MMNITFDGTETLVLATLVLLVGHLVRDKVKLFRKYFIPAPVIGGVIFSLGTLVGYEYDLFKFSFDSMLKDLLMVVFFTIIGASASFRMLKKGGLLTFSFLIAAVFLVLLQNGLGIMLAKVFGINPLLGLAAGSISLTGGHGTSAAFGPLLEEAGAAGAMTAAIAAATFGLVSGCLIGGPIGRALISKGGLTQNTQRVVPEEQNLRSDPNDIFKEERNLTETSLVRATFFVIVAIGFGLIIGHFLRQYLVLPIYIGPMLGAAIFRNIADATGKKLPLESIAIGGNIALSLFLAMALMSMRLWELASLAVPLISMLVLQTILMASYAYFVTFRLMGKDYDAAVIAVGHCGFGMGATPNAMANMEAFTKANGPSPAAFFAIPLVGSLFIDFFNAGVITLLIDWLV